MNTHIFHLTFVCAPVHPDSRKCLHLPLKTRYRYISSKYFPQVFYSYRAHIGCLPPTSGISVIAYLDDWLVHHPDHQVLLCPQSQLLKTLDFLGLKVKRRKIRTGPGSEYPFSRTSLMPGSRDSVTPRILSLRDNSTCVQNILPNSSVLYTRV